MSASRRAFSIDFPPTVNPWSGNIDVGCLILEYVDFYLIIQKKIENERQYYGVPSKTSSSSS